MNKSKTTDTKQAVEQKMYNELKIIEDPNASNEEKKAAIRRLKNEQKHLKNVDDKEINGKQYPMKSPHLYDPTPQTEKEKKEILKLIDSVETPEPIIYEIDDLDGIFPPFRK